MESVAGKFITWEMLATYASLAVIVYMFVEFTKELPYIKLIKTKYYSAMVSFGLILIVNMQRGSFAWIDIILYALSAIAISLTDNGLADFNHPVDKTKKE